MGLLDNIRAKRAAKKQAQLSSALSSAKSTASYSSGNVSTEGKAIVSAAKESPSNYVSTSTATKIATSTPVKISKGGGGSSPSPAATTEVITTTVNKSGGVTQGGTTYVGKAVVPGSGGLTANQIRAAALIEARKQYGSNVGQGRFTATYTKTTTTPTPRFSKDFKPEVTTAEKTLARQGITEPETPLATAIKDVPFYNKTIGEAFAREGFQRESPAIKKVIKAGITSGTFGLNLPFRFMDQTQKIQQFSGEVLSEAIPKSPGQLITTAGLGVAFELTAPAGIAAKTASGIIVKKSIRTGISGFIAGTGIQGALNPNLTAQQRVASGIIGGFGVLGVAGETIPVIRAVEIPQNFGRKGSLPVNRRTSLSSTFDDTLTIKAGNRNYDFVPFELKDVNRLALENARRSAAIKEPTAVVDIDTSALRNQANRLRSGADIVFIDEFGRPTIRSATKTPKESKPITFDFDLTEINRQAANQANRFRSGADVIDITNIKEPTIKSTAAKEVKPIVFDIIGEKKISTSSQKSTTKQVQQLEQLQQQQQAQSVNVLNLDKIKFTSPKELQALKTRQAVKNAVVIKQQSISQQLQQTKITQSLGQEQIQIQQQQAQKQVQEDLQIQIQVQQSRGRTSPRFRTNTIQTVAQPQAIKQIEITKQIPRQTITPAFSIAQLTNTKQSPFLSTKSIQTQEQKRIGLPSLNKRFQPTKTSTGFFGVQVRRGGIFRSVGAGLSAKEAKFIGQSVTSGTLAATFRVTGKGAKRLRTPKGFYSKAGKDGVLFIEKRSKRLSKKTETKEIQAAKRRKKRVTKKKKK